MQCTIGLGHKVLVTAFAALLAPTAVHAWGCEGHQTVALIAQAQLNPHARAATKSLLQKNPIKKTTTKNGKPVTLRRRCASALGAFVDASTWPDDIRKTAFDQWNSADWHFLDIPRGATRDRLPEFCPADGCVTKAIDNQVAMLKSHASKKEKADALRFLIHFVGDIHQPLHCTTNSDRGGNCVPLTVLDRAGQFDNGELHGCWDTTIIEADPAYPATANMDHDVTVYAKVLTSEFQSQIPTWSAQGVHAEDWAWESHQLAESNAYGKLPTAIPIEPERGQLGSCVVNGDDISARMAALQEQLGQPYETTADPVIHEQLAKAGTRLALILNSIWP